MKQSELIRGVITALEDQTARISRVRANISPEVLNRVTAKNVWSVGQILEHLRLSNEPYTGLMVNGLNNAISTDTDPDVRFTWVGKFLIRAAGPDGNAPAPKPFVPGPGPYTDAAFDSFMSDQERILEMARNVGTKNLSEIKIRNPLIKFLRMNLADCFAIAQHHTERHVRQIEERV